MRNGEYTALALSILNIEYGMVKKKYRLTFCSLNHLTMRRPDIFNCTYSAIGYNIIYKISPSA